MELKVWVEGFPRVVCGLTETSTCHDVVVALASATGRTGRFTLIERWRESERLLSPSECPLRVLQKWGEYATDVQFILKHSDPRTKTTAHKHDKTRRTDKFNHNFSPHHPPRSGGSRTVKRSLTFSGGHGPTIHQGHDSLESLEDASSVTSGSRSSLSPYASFDSPSRPDTGYSPGRSLFNSLDRKRPGSTTAIRMPPSTSLRNQSMFSSLERRVKRTPPVQGVRPLQVSQSAPAQGRPHHGIPPLPPSAVQGVPPQQSPPPVQGVPPLQTTQPNVPPRNSSHSPAKHEPHTATDQNRNIVNKGSERITGSTVKIKPERGKSSGEEKVREGERNPDWAEKAELIRLVNLQMDKTQQQQSQLKLLETEIRFWEQREKEQEQRHLQHQKEKDKLEETDTELQGQLEELELVSWDDKLLLERHQSETLQGQITSLRSQIKEREELLEQSEKEAQKMATDLSREQTEQEAEKARIEVERQRQEEECKKQQKKKQQDLDDLNKQIEEKDTVHNEGQTCLEKLCAEENQLDSDMRSRHSHLNDLEKQVREANMQTFGTSMDKVPPIALGVSHA